MTSPFPTEYVDKGNPVYQKLPRFQFTLKPGKGGSSINDYKRALNDLGTAAESQILSESVPHVPANGRELSLEFLKEEATHIISRCGVDWFRGCDFLQVRHHPIKSEKLVSILSRLLFAPRLNHYAKLLSIRHKGEFFVLEVVLDEDEYMPEDSILIIPVNPSDPAAVRLTEHERTDGFRFSELYGSKKDMETFALESLCRDLCSRSGVPIEDLKCGYEPLGKDTFPDFKMCIGGETWAVEVARVESGMVSYVQVDRKLDARGMRKALKNRITREGIGEALRQEINDKASKRTDCTAYSWFCLLLVDIVDSIGDGECSVWNDCDLAAFDAVVTVKLDGSVSYIKGAADLQAVDRSENDTPIANAAAC